VHPLGRIVCPERVPDVTPGSADGRLRARDFLGIGLLVGTQTPPLGVLAVRFAHG
jgi:hypothetical protein